MKLFKLGGGFYYYGVSFLFLFSSEVDVRCFYLCTIMILSVGCVSESPRVTKQFNEFSISNNFVDCGIVTPELVDKNSVKISQPSDWVILGSSTAAGSGASSVAKGWVGLVSSRMSSDGVRIHNLSKGGATTYHALSSSCVVDSSRPKSDLLRNVDHVLTYKPDVVILNFPSNDAVSGFSFSETVYNLMLMRQQFSEKNVTTVIIMSQPRNSSKDIQQRMLDLDNTLKQLLGACQIELHSKLRNSAGGLAIQYDSGDGVHLNDYGHQIVANAVIELVKSDKCIIL